MISKDADVIIILTIVKDQKGYAPNIIFPSYYCKSEKNDLIQTQRSIYHYSRSMVVFLVWVHNNPGLNTW